MFRYRCDSCRTTSLPVRTRAEVLDVRDAHRRRKHGGHVPDGEHLQRARRQPTGSLRPLVALVLLLALPLLAWITQHAH